MKQTISVIYYKCPVCGRNSTNKKEIERHFRQQHQIKDDEVIYLLQDMRCWMACERIREEKSSGNGKRVLQKTYYSRGRRRNGDKGFFLVKRRIWVCKNRRWIAERDRK